MQWMLLSEFCVMVSKNRLKQYSYEWIMCLYLHASKLWSLIRICDLAEENLNFEEEQIKRQRIHVLISNTLLKRDTHERMVHFCSNSFILQSKMLTCNLLDVNLNVEEEQLFVPINHLRLSLWFLHINEKKLVSLLLRSMKIRQTQRNQSYLAQMHRSHYRIQDLSGRAHFYLHQKKWF